MPTLILNYFIIILTLLAFFTSMLVVFFKNRASNMLKCLAALFCCYSSVIYIIKPNTFFAIGFFILATVNLSILLKDTK